MAEPVTIAIAGFLLNVLVLAVGGTWKLSRVEASIRKAIAVHQREAYVEIDKVRRETGESMTAMREKIREVELYCRDTYVRRDSFFKVADEFTGGLKAMSDKIEARLERMEEKIDANR